MRRPPKTRALRALVGVGAFRRLLGRLARSAWDSGLRPLVGIAYLAVPRAAKLGIHEGR